MTAAEDHDRPSFENVSGAIESLDRNALILKFYLRAQTMYSGERIDVVERVDWVDGSNRW